MRRNDFFKSENLVYASFLVVGFLGLLYLKGLETVVFLFLFLGMAFINIYAIVGVYNVFRGVKEKWLLWQILLSILFGGILYKQYGSYALLKSISVSLVITIVIGIYSIISNRNR